MFAAFTAILIVGLAAATCVPATAGVAVSDSSRAVWAIASDMHAGDKIQRVVSIPDSNRARAWPSYLVDVASSSGDSIRQYEVAWDGDLTTVFPGPWVVSFDGRGPKKAVLISAPISVSTASWVLTCVAPQLKGGETVAEIGSDKDHKSGRSANDNKNFWLRDGRVHVVDVYTRNARTWFRWGKARGGRVFVVSAVGDSCVIEDVRSGGRR
jgi:hypothetical protein